jgi:hypothetical protein
MLIYTQKPPQVARRRPETQPRAEEKQMRRSFRVATVFTGVGALAGGLGPTVFATTAQAAVIRPFIANKPCEDITITDADAVFYYPNDDHPAECFYGSGVTAAGANIASLCPGYNNGSIWGFVDGSYTLKPFSPSEGRAKISRYDGRPGYTMNVSGVAIYSWWGDATC